MNVSRRNFVELASAAVGVSLMAPFLKLVKAHATSYAFVDGGYAKAPSATYLPTKVFPRGTVEELSGFDGILREMPSAGILTTSGDTYVDGAYILLSDIPTGDASDAQTVTGTLRVRYPNAVYKQSDSSQHDLIVTVNALDIVRDLGSKTADNALMFILSTVDAIPTSSSWYRLPMIGNPVVRFDGGQIRPNYYGYTRAAMRATMEVFVDGASPEETLFLTFHDVDQPGISDERSLSAFMESVQLISGFSNEILTVESGAHRNLILSDNFVSGTKSVTDYSSTFGNLANANSTKFAVQLYSAVTGLFMSPFSGGIKLQKQDDTLS